MSKMNRIANCRNEFQGTAKRVLCVCSAGLLRSPTAALVLSGEPFNFNTRAAGIVSEYALIPVDDVLLAWADEIVCMETEHANLLKKITKKNIVVLGIEDDFEYRSPKLMALISERYLASGD